MHWAVLLLLLTGPRLIASVTPAPSDVQTIQAEEEVDYGVFEQGMVGQPTGSSRYGGVNLAADHSWVEVMRFGSKCRQGQYVEGYSLGYPTDCGHGYEKLNRSDLVSCSHSYNPDGNGPPPAEVGYGCWFYVSEPQLQEYRFGSVFPVTRSSGVSVNVGKSLRASWRADISAALGLPCSNPPVCDAVNTVQDKLWCERAVKLGYDSILVARPHRANPDCVFTRPGFCGYPELTLCTGECMTKEQTEACLSGTELRTAEGNPCNCSNKAHALNCGEGSMLYGRPDDGKQTCRNESGVPLTSPQLGELYLQRMSSPEDDG